jgi:hypothetical protein
MWEKNAAFACREDKTTPVAPGYIEHPYWFAVRTNPFPTFPVSPTFYRMVYSALKEETIGTSELLMLTY